MLIVHLAAFAFAFEDLPPAYITEDDDGYKVVWDKNLLEGIEVTSNLLRLDYDAYGPVTTPVDSETLLSLRSDSADFTTGSFSLAAKPEVRLLQGSLESEGTTIMVEHLVVTMNHPAEQKRSSTIFQEFRRFSVDGSSIVSLSQQDWDDFVRPITEMVLSDGTIERSQPGFSAIVEPDPGSPPRDDFVILHGREVLPADEELSPVDNDGLLPEDLVDSE